MRIVPIVLILYAIPFLAQAQNTIHGQVTDELGLPVYRASISIAASEAVTYTNAEGQFSLTSEQDFHWKINVASVGYKTESYFVLSGGNTQNIILEYDEKMKKLLEAHSCIDFRFLPETSKTKLIFGCLLYTSPSPRDKRQSRMPSSA